MPGRDPDSSAAALADRVAALTAPAGGEDRVLVDRAAEAVEETAGAGGETGRAVPDGVPADEAEPVEPVMPSPPFPSFRSRPTLPHQPPGVGFESGRDSRAR